MAIILKRNDNTPIKRVEGKSHALPDEWLASRVYPWMLLEANGDTFWICTNLADGRFIHASDNGFQQPYMPPQKKVHYAQKIVAFLNKQASFGGAWLAGWLFRDRRFYLLWKDEDGDLQIPVECDKPWVAIRNWNVEDWERQAVTAYEAWCQVMEDIDVPKDAQVKLAQGQKRPG